MRVSACIGSPLVVSNVISSSLFAAKVIGCPLNSTCRSLPMVPKNPDASTHSHSFRGRNIDMEHCRTPVFRPVVSVERPVDVHDEGAFSLGPPRRFPADGSRIFQCGMS